VLEIGQKATVFDRRRLNLISFCLKYLNSRRKILNYQIMRALLPEEALRTSF
jgi:hypothetical protein